MRDTRWDRAARLKGHAFAGRFAAFWTPAVPPERQYLARRFGHDGLVVRNIRDSIDGGPLGTTYAALRPGTVTSPLTGAPIYSLLAALAGQQYGAN